MLPPLPNGSKFQIIRFAISQPKTPSFLDGLADAGRRMNALLDFVKRSDLPRFGILFSGKCLEPALTALVNVINDPSFASLTARGLPFALSHRHVAPLWD